MESATPARVLVVAHRTAATTGLRDAVRHRAAAGPARFTLLVPRTAHGTAPAGSEGARSGAGGPRDA